MFCWGRDAGGMIGDGTPIADTPEERARPIPVPVLGLSDPLAEVGEGFAITARREVFLWKPLIWVLGEGRAVHEPRTRAAPWSLAPADTRQLALGTNFGCARDGDGRVRCAGSNASGALGDGTTVSRAEFALVPLLRPAVSIAAAESRACAALEGGQLVCWGRDPLRSVSRNCEPSLHGDPPAQAAAPHDLCGPTPHIDRIPVPVAGASGVVDVALGGDAGCARLRDGGVVCFGANDRGQLGDGTRTGRSEAAPVRGLRGAVAQLAMGYGTVCARYADGTVDCWGSLALNNMTAPTRVPGLDDATDIATRLTTSCAVRARDGNIWCWGTLDAGFEPDPARGAETPAALRWKR